MRNIFPEDPEVRASSNIAGKLTDLWQKKRVTVVVPILNVALYICVAMSIMLFIERLYMTCVILGIKFLGKKRYTKYRLNALKEEVEKKKKEYPKVLVQIPMYNEREVRRSALLN